MTTSHDIQTALTNLIVIAGLPFLGYFLFHRFRHKRGFREVLQRAGLQTGELRHLAIAGIASLLTVTALLLWPLDLELLTREGSAMASFSGLGFSGMTLMLALLYGVVKTGFCEELLFRGLIAGSLGRRMEMHWANILQAAIFTLPHLAVLMFAPELKLLPAGIFVFSLFTGWLRIASGSIYGPWLIHSTANVTMCLLIATRTSGAA